MRLKELQQQRTITRLQEKVRHLHEGISSCERNSVTLEQRLVQSTKVRWMYPFHLLSENNCVSCL